MDFLNDHGNDYNMKHNVLKLMMKTIFITLVMTLMLPTPINAKAEVEHDKIDFQLSASKKITTIDENESITYMIDGFSYDFTGTDIKIGSDFQFKILSERYDEALEIKEIVVPPLIDSDTGEIEVSLFGWTDLGSFFEISTKIANTSSGPTIFTRDEIETFRELNDGKLPTQYVLYLTNVTDPKTYRAEPSQKLEFNEPIKFEYNIFDRVSMILKPNKDNIPDPRPNHFFQVESTYYIEPDVNTRYDDLKTIYSYIHSSTVEFENKDFIFLEDDKDVKLDFKIKNNSIINPNRLMYVGFELDDKDVIEFLNTEDDGYDWEKSGNLYYTSLYNNNGWMNIEAQEELNLSKTIRVKEMIDEDIFIKPFIFQYYDTSKRIYGDTIHVSSSNESDITVYYVDEEGTQISNPSTFSGEIGSEFNIVALDIDGYTPQKYYLYDVVLDDVTIDFEEEDQIAAVMYEELEDPDDNDSGITTPDEEDKNPGIPEPDDEGKDFEITVPDDEETVVTEPEEDSKDSELTQPGDENRDFNFDQTDEDENLVEDKNNSIDNKNQQNNEEMLPSTGQGTPLPVLVGLLTITFGLVLGITALYRSKVVNDETDFKK